MLTRQQQNMDRQTALMEGQQTLMEGQQATIEAQRQDTSRLTEALVRALDRIGEDRELRDRRSDKKYMTLLADMQAKIDRLEAKANKGARNPATI